MHGASLLRVQVPPPASPAAAYQTARQAYAKALQAALPTILEQAQVSETLQFI